MRVVELFIDVFETSAAALENVNFVSGTQYKPQRLLDWKNGHRNPPAKVVDHMRRTVLRARYERSAELIKDLSLD